MAAGLLAAAGGLLAPACADNESSLFIRSCIAPDDSCTFQADPSGSHLFAGQVDVAGYSSYTCAALVGNQVVRRGSTDQLRTETSRITLYEADVRVVDLSGASISYGDGSAVEYTVPITGFVDPGTGANPGYGLASVPLLDAGSIQSLTAAGTAEVVSLVTIRGRTLGGQELETPEWAFPISLCNGCRCVNTTPSICCSTPDDPLCVDLDPPFTGCIESQPYDCRVIGSTCPL